MLFVFIEADILGKLVKTAVNTGADIARTARICKNLFVHSLFHTHDGRKHHKARFLGKRHDAVKNTVGGLLGDLLIADRAVRKNKLKNWLLLGAVVSWAGFIQQDLWLFFTLFTAVYFLWRCFCERRFPWKGILISAVVFTAIGVPSFVDLFSNVVQGRKSQMASGENITDRGASKEDQNWEFVTNWSMPPEDAVEFFVPRVHGDTSCPFVLSISSRLGNGIKPYTGRLGRPMNASAGNYRQHSLYVGRVTCFLVLVSLLAFFTKQMKCVCRRDLAFFSVAAVVFFLLSLGRFCEPVYRMIFALPFGSLIRCPVKWHHLTEFCLVFMAGCGIEILLRYAENVRMKQGMDTKGTRNMLNQWKHRGYILQMTNDNYKKSENYKSKV